MLRWFPWRQLISRLARARGFIDPMKVLSRLESFAQPMEVKEPLELLRAGIVFHARGLLNTSAIQHNLDWAWPYWVERQYDPRDDSFIPRSFSITHVNLTHRNWTAVGIPDCDELPLVDPAGLVTPFWDGWSLDAWVLADDGTRLLPSRAGDIRQHLDYESGIAVVTSAARDGLTLESRADVQTEAARTCLHLGIDGQAPAGGWLVLSLRPFNPEGVSFVQRIEAGPRPDQWRVDGKQCVEFSPPDRQRFSYYNHGDVLAALPDGGERDGVRCRVGMATAAALYRLEPNDERHIEVRVPLLPKERKLPSGPTWEAALSDYPRLEVVDDKVRFLYEAAVRTLILHSPLEVYPGPFTYKRFWFRDAAFMLDALLALGKYDRVERVLDLFPGRQTRAGHYFSQDGEWDSNGEALWILHRYCQITGRPPKAEWRRSIARGGRWIDRKRVPPGKALHAGLLPAGFSAEHLGPYDYYFWDDFWGVAGLRCAADLLAGYGDKKAPRRLRRVADELEAATVRSLEHAAQRLGRAGMPASPYRRLDCGSIGSLAVGYPLQLWHPRDPRLLDTAEYLIDNTFVHGGFFQDVIHSGINPYLTLHVAQVLQRAGDPRSCDLLRTVAELASPTGQWPEAVHPRTGGGCMGDGQHAWAAAEWVLALRNAFVREEAGELVVGAGIDPEWLRSGQEVRFGPTPTTFGKVTIFARQGAEQLEVRVDGEWRGSPPKITAALPGIEAATVHLTTRASGGADKTSAEGGVR